MNKKFLLLFLCILIANSSITVAQQPPDRKVALQALAGSTALLHWLKDPSTFQILVDVIKYKEVNGSGIIIGIGKEIEVDYLCGTLGNNKLYLAGNGSVGVPLSGQFDFSTKLWLFLKLNRNNLQIKVGPTIFYNFRCKNCKPFLLLSYKKRFERIGLVIAAAIGMQEIYKRDFFSECNSIVVVVGHAAAEFSFTPYLKVGFYPNAISFGVGIGN